MQKKRIWRILPVMSITSLVLIAISLLSLMWNVEIALCELGAAIIAIIVLLLKLRSIQRDIHYIVSKTMEDFGAENRQSLSDFPVPAVITSENGAVVWYNKRFKDTVLGGEDSFGPDIKSIAKNLNIGAFDKYGSAVDINTKNRRFTVFGTPVQHKFYILYWIENTELKNLADEYRESRPVIAVVMIDNYDELVQNAREGEKGEIINTVEKTLLAWVATSSGFIRHSDRDKYVFVFEERHLRKFVETRFEILDKVRQIVAGERMPATLSIGIGRGGKTLAAAEEMARQALDMALGRGGDQVAVKSQNGFEFYGGASKAVEKRTKVKTRIIASALAELIEGSENVLIMGHRNGDLDSLGASAALYKSIVSLGKSAAIVINTQNAFVQQSVERLKATGYEKAFIDPINALLQVTRWTLLIIVDTHRKGFIESPELYEAVKTVVVIDHHRKMVDFIDNAVIFYHEPYASSASEMVAELVQYISDPAITSVEAGALLAGMTLDTRNFTVRTGVRTFEAAAYLRRKGADTAKVKLLFSSSMGSYKKRVKLISTAEIYKTCAISAYSGNSDPDMKIVAPQAADELMTIMGINASFVLYSTDDGIAVSARSMGGVNVQLIMETLGGGGHQTMAGTQIPGNNINEAKNKVKAAIDKYYEENK